MKTSWLLAVCVAALAMGCTDPADSTSDLGATPDGFADVSVEDGAAPTDTAGDAGGGLDVLHRQDIAPDAAQDSWEPIDIGGDLGVPEDVALDTDALQDAGADVDAVSPPTEPTLPYFVSESEILWYCASESQPDQCKFVLTRFQDALGGEAHWMNPTFYTLHDEWYWFRLLNGDAISGYSVEPVQGLEFSTVQEVIDWAKQQTVLPLGLSWYGERLYSSKFYADSFGESRFFGVGSLLHFDANPERVLPEELWLFDLEFVDKLTEKQLAAFFGRLSEVLPPSVASQLKWLVRSSGQEILAQSIEAAGGPLAGRIVRYEQLVVKGDEVGYNPGITAGTVRVVPKGAGGGSYSASEIVVLSEVPDYLPPVAGIVTAVPQTPLAHLNLLAKSRGTPNAYVAGIESHPGVLEWDKWDAPVILKVMDDGVLWHPITKPEYDTWKSMKVQKTFEIPPIDLTNAPLTVDLGQGGVGAVEGLVPLCGGKASGVLAFNDLPDLDRPDLPLCLTIRAYAEHMESLEPTIQAVLEDPEFATDALVRFVVLEGPKEFLAQHPGVQSAAWLASFKASHDGTTLLGSVLAKEGVKGLVRSKAIKPSTLQAITATLQARYATFADSQGLRFRSSSTAEDVPGFNGAGLYDSNTGYLKPLLQTDPDEKKKSIQWAILKTWASYWTYEAFEERQAAGIEHLSGDMGLLIHARFDDDLEVSNGVITTYLARGQYGDTFRMVVNVQKGALSVTNPEPGNPAKPEIDVVEDWGSGPKITRVQASTEAEPGELLLDDGRLLWMFGHMRVLTALWLDTANGSLPGAQQSLSQVLDLEFRHMAPGWPALASGQVHPERFVFKQVRTLDETQPVPPAIEVLPVPRDVIGKSMKVQRRTCTTGWFTLETVEVYTDPAKSWAFDYSKEPFNGYVKWTLTKPIPGFTTPVGVPLTLLHTDFALQAHPFMHHGPWDLYLELKPSAASTVGFDTFTMYVWGDWTVTAGSAYFGDAQGSCAVKDLLISPAAYLESLLP